SHLHLDPIIRENRHLGNIVLHLSAISIIGTHDRVDTAGVITQHAADATMVVRGRIGTKSEPMFLRMRLHVVQHDTGLHLYRLRGDIEIEHIVVIFRHVHHHRHITRLTRQARPAPTVYERSLVTPADRDYFF